ncbi:hypothetical protein TNCV_1485211 [Trichonephila clavipes]|nr:hypothetical protein TNCV_1485211 [Trichonephila clavipes]
MPSKLRGMSPKKENDLRRSLEHLKMMNELMCQFRPDVIMIQQFFLHALHERNLGNARLQQDGATAYTRVSMGVLREAFPE